MALCIQFDSESALRTIKIDNVATNTELSTKLLAKKLASLKDTCREDRLGAATAPVSGGDASRKDASSILTAKAGSLIQNTNRSLAQKLIKEHTAIAAAFAAR